MSTAESVTLSSLEASVNHEGHLEFLSALIARGDLDPARRALWTARLDEVRKRREDPDLYLAVVGEFSSGKSTLLNALIREALLPTDVLPATTAAAVLVRSGPQRRLRVEYLDGHREEITDVEVIPRQLAHLITVEEAARTVARVTIDHPAEVLREGLVAVDLPGSNVENTRHIKVAGQTIRDVCDTALVAIPADIPVSESLAEFLRMHLAESLHRCIFVVTKIDQLSSRDREQVFATIEGRLRAKLGVPSPLVLGASASALLGESLADGTDAKTPGAAGDAYRELQTDFLEAEQQIVGFLRERRVLILIERSAALLAVLFEGIQEDLRGVAERRRKERETLAASLPPPLGPFLAECRVRHGQALEERLQTLADDLLKSFAALRQQTLQAVWSSLSAGKKRAQVVGAATYGAESLVTKARSSLWEELLKASTRIGSEIHEEMASFDTRFTNCYRNFTTAEGSFSGADFLPSMPTDWTAWGRPKLGQVAQQEGQRKVYMAAGGVLGLFVGICLFFALGIEGISDKCGPGCFFAFVALVLSPILGARFGSDISIPIDSLRKAYWSDLGPAIEMFFSQIDSAVLMHFQGARRTAREIFDAFLDGYQTRYDARILASIAKGEARITEGLRIDRRLSDDLADLERRRLDLQQARHGLKLIQQL